MGLFLAATAFKTDNFDLVSRSIVEYSKKYDVAASILGGISNPNEKRHALIFGPSNGWVVVLWPTYFNVHDAPLAKELAAKYGLTASTVSVYDGDYWCHGLYSRTEQIDSYCSMPDYWAENEEMASKSKQQFKGSPDSVSNLLGLNVDKIKGYYTHISFGSNSGKVNETDQFELNNVWVFVDFWHSIGINYPENVSSYKIVVDLTTSFSDKLPQGGV